MLINEATHKVGLSKKSIRYYEENGLLTPTRGKENDYRIYTNEDIKKLKIIKFLRELDVPIRELKLLNSNEITLKECMEERIKKINEQQENYKKIKNMCKEIYESNTTFLDIEITKYFEKMNTLNKEGFTMRNVRTNKQKKIRGAIFSSIIFGIWFIIMIIGITCFQFKEINNLPWIAYGIIMTILCFPVIGITYNLILRIKEINKGEEDEASKY